MNPTLLPPHIPETAPFNAVQRAWLNGFFAGLFGTDVRGDLTAPPVVAAKPQAEEEELPWHDPSLSLDERLRLADGQPLPRVLMAAMAQLDCGACGYLCKTYAEAVAGGQEKSLTLCAPGGKLTAVKLREILARAAVSPGAAATSARTELNAETRPRDSREASRTTPHGRENPFPARLVRCVPLNKGGGAKDTRLVVLDLEGSGITYEPGDSLGVYPENCPELVDEIDKALGARGDEGVRTPSGDTVPFREALSRHFEIENVGDALSDLLLGSVKGGDDAACLRALLDGDGVSSSPVGLIDFLRLVPSARPRPREVAAALPALRPRLYSIASSLKAHPNEVHLTVGVVRYEARGRIRKGVTSTHLAERVRHGERVRVFVRPSHGFKLPPSGNTPILMIGPGTGIAPFRAFLQERKARGERGKAWLFFGDQRRAMDFLYEEELQTYLAEGFLTRLDVAFSRDQKEKVYVQHRMREHASEFWRWIEEGACVYVCGDARSMASDVDLALRKIVETEGRRSPAEAMHFVQELAKAKRYQRDVY